MSGALLSIWKVIFFQIIFPKKFDIAKLVIAVQSILEYSNLVFPEVVMGLRIIESRSKNIFSYFFFIWLFDIYLCFLSKAKFFRGLWIIEFGILKAKLNKTSLKHCWITWKIDIFLLSINLKFAYFAESAS